MVLKDAEVSFKGRDERHKYTTLRTFGQCQRAVRMFEVFALSVLKRKCRIISHICIYEVMLYKKYILGRKEN